MSRILLGISGGVDSCVSAWQLQRDGHEVVAVTLFFHDGPERRSALEKAREVCSKLDVEHHVVDARERFAAEVRQAYLRCCEQGRFADPCSLCTPDLKFPLLAEQAEQHGCDLVATGHYARVATDEFGIGLRPYQLCVPQEKYKEQTYYLYRLGQETLARTVFPLASIAKPVVRRMSMQAGLFRMARIDDTQYETCFLDGADERRWLAEQDDARIEGGPIVHITTGAVLGRHDGLRFHAPGSRIDVEGHGRMFVAANDPSSQTLYVSAKGLSARESCRVRDVRWTSVEPIDRRRSCRVKLGARHTPVPAQVLPVGDEVVVTFSEAVYDVRPGRTAVFYSDDLVLGGGVLVG